MKNFRTFDVLLTEKVYIVQGELTGQNAKIFMHVYCGHWSLKEVKYNTVSNPYSRSDWKFLKDLAIYVEYICMKASKDKLEIDVPEELDYQKERK
jgi:hypothetical protein